MRGPMLVSKVEAGAMKTSRTLLPRNQFVAIGMPPWNVIVRAMLKKSFIIAHRKRTIVWRVMNVVFWGGVCRLAKRATYR